MHKIRKISIGKRCLSYREYGDLKGIPIIFNHGNLNSRLFAPAWEKSEEIAQSLGVRVIAVDRHGIGESTYEPSMNHTAYAQDIQELTSQLDINKYGTIGFSSGGPYSMSLAAKFPEQVLALALVSSDAQYIEMGEEMIQRQYGSAGFDSDYALLAAKVNYNNLKTAYETMSRLERKSLALLDLNEAVKQGMQGAAKDMLLETCNWDFSLPSIKCPIAVWHGESDEDVPLEAFHYICKSLTGSVKMKKLLLPGETHTLIRRHWQEILKDLVEEINSTGKL